MSQIVLEQLVSGYVWDVCQLTYQSAVFFLLFVFNDV